MLRLRFLLLAGLLFATILHHAQAAENWNLCRVPSFAFVEPGELESGQTRVEAQQIASEDSEQIHFAGGVRVERSDQRINADEIFIDKSTRELQASGNVVFENSDYRLQSPSIRIDDLNNSASFLQPEFELPERHARGSAQRIDQIDANRSRYAGLFYTACDPGDLDWHLEAETLEIDDSSGRGTATDTTLYFKEIPFLYLPWFQFPIDDRRLSGVLAPRFGYSDEQGLNFGLPVYWNIAGNTDMTITPTAFSKRGLQLDTENRYLFRANQGQLDLSYLDDDDVGDTRWFQRWRHQTRLTDRTDADLLLADVSDVDFFDDFSNTAPEYNDTRHLESHFSLKRRGEDWRGAILWQNYQTLDTTTEIENRPYNRLPRITLDGELRTDIDNSEAPVHIEWVEFDRDDSVTGQRTHFKPAISWRSSRSWYFFEPELQLAMTRYELDNNPGDNSIERSLPTLAIDTGLVLERSAGSRDQWLQTLEPRLYFLHTPYEEQDDIPDFDTSLLSPTYDNLFRNNRFSGADRIGDANQVTFGLASRLYDNDNGDELLHARAGQIFYFKDRRVSLDGIRQQDSKSDLIAELDLWPNPRVKIATRLVYDQEEHDINDRDLSIHYSDQGFAANLGYYFDDEELEQALVSLVYPLNERWTLVAKYHHSLLFDQPVDNLLGLNYESCCWGIKILAGQSGDEVDNFAETDNVVYFEITLKGLSDAGRDIDAQLDKAIPGYNPGF